MKTKEEIRRKKKEGRGKKEEGRGKKEEISKEATSRKLLYPIFHLPSPPLPIGSISLLRKSNFFTVRASPLASVG